MMRVLPGRRPARETAAVEPIDIVVPIPAPTLGLVLTQNSSQMPPNSALVLVNGLPTHTGVRIRGGSQQAATTGSLPVESLFSYRSGNVNKLFAASGGSIFDVTSPADVTIAPTAVVTGMTSNDYSTASITAGGTSYMYVANGTDALKVYDGSTFSDSTITGITLSSVSQSFVFKKRAFFILKDTLQFAYLGVGAYQGAATTFDLTGVFKRGGSLLFGATWSQDAGDGMDDKAVFITTLGEAAIYAGTDPSDANAWEIQGRYDITPPLGKSAYTNAGGDLVIMTENGLVPLSLATQKEASELSLHAISREIEPLWAKEVTRRSLPWQIVEVPRLNLALISLPSTGNLPAESFAVNLQTSRWGVYEGWDTRSVGEINGDGYFGTNDGKIFKMEAGGTDNGEPYQFRCALAPQMLGSASQKTAKRARATFKALSGFNPKVAADINLGVNFPAPPSAGAGVDASSAWDSGLWDSAIWDDGLQQYIQSKWFSLGKTGFAITPLVMATIATPNNPNAELVSLDISFVQGSFHA